MHKAGMKERKEFIRKLLVQERKPKSTSCYPHKKGKAQRQSEKEKMTANRNLGPYRN